MCFNWKHTDFQSVDLNLIQYLSKLALEKSYYRVFACHFQIIFE